MKKHPSHRGDPTTTGPPPADFVQPYLPRDGHDQPVDSPALVGAPVFTPQGTQLGTIDSVRVDPGSGWPRWASVQTTERTTLIPLAHATLAAGGAFCEDRVAGAQSEDQPDDDLHRRGQRDVGVERQLGSGEQPKDDSPYRGGLAEPHSRGRKRQESNRTAFDLCTNIRAGPRSWHDTQLGLSAFTGARGIVIP